VRFAHGGLLEEWDPAKGEVRTVSNETKVDMEVNDFKVYRTAKD